MQAQRQSDLTQIALQPSLTNAEVTGSSTAGLKYDDDARQSFLRKQERLRRRQQHSNASRVSQDSNLQRQTSTWQQLPRLFSSGTSVLGSQQCRVCNEDQRELGNHCTNVHMCFLCLAAGRDHISDPSVTQNTRALRHWPGLPRRGRWGAEAKARCSVQMQHPTSGMSYPQA